MRRTNLIFLILASIFCLETNAQINLNSNGNVGIGTTASSTYKFDVNAGWGIRFQLLYGGVLLDSWWEEPTFRPTINNTGYLGESSRYWYASYVNKAYYIQHPAWPSDIRLKKDINSITDSDIDNLSKVKGFTFKFKEDLYSNPSSDSLSAEKKVLRKDKKDNETQYGFIAQELIDLYPDIATYDTAKDMYFVKYTAFIPLLVEGHKKQQVLIEEMQKEIEDLKKQVEITQNSKLKSTSSALGTEVVQEAEKNALFQNAPNPFSQITTIEYVLAEKVQSAMICIYNMNGTQLKSISLHQKGYGDILINGGEFKAGMYMYSLIVDGQVIDTKQMILTY